MNASAFVPLSSSSSSVVLCPHGAVYGLTQGLGRQNREKEPELVVAARQGREKPEKITTKEGPRTGLRTSGKTDNTPAWPNLHRTGPGREKHINRGAKASALSVSSALGHSSPRVFRLMCPHASKMDFPAIF